MALIAGMFNILIKAISRSIANAHVLFLYFYPGTPALVLQLGNFQTKKASQLN